MQYSDKVMDHFQNPRNVGEIKDADGIGEVGNLKCGDVMYIYIKVGKRPLRVKSEKLKVKSDGEHSVLGSDKKSLTTNNKQLNPEFEEFIEDIKFKTLGCAAAIAASSMMTELAKGKTLDEAYNITRDDVNDSLGKLPAQKYHCSILSAEGIRKAILDYRSRKN